MTIRESKTYASPLFIDLLSQTFIKGLKAGSHDPIFGSVFLTGIASTNRNIVSRQ